MAGSEERVALITGGGKGVGAGIARQFCKAGVRCCINYNSSAALAQKTLAGILDAGGEAFLHQADVTDPYALDGMINETLRRYGRLDVLVNNAAMQPNLFIDEYDFDKLARLWEINIGGYWHAAKRCIPYLRQSPCARIINISSIHGKRPTTFDAGYAMTKGAIRMFTRELAVELAQDHIPVNTIDLGGCKIEGKTGHAPFRMYTPMPTYGRRVEGVRTQCTPDEVGALAVFLLSREAESLNGDGIRQDMGLMLI